MHKSSSMRHPLTMSLDFHFVPGYESRIVIGTALNANNSRPPMRVGMSRLAYNGQSFLG